MKTTRSTGATAVAAPVAKAEPAKAGVEAKPAKTAAEPVKKVEKAPAPLPIQVLSCEPDAWGCAVVSVVASPEQKLEFAVIGKDGTVFELQPSEVRRSTLTDVNLVATQDLAPEWALGKTKVRLEFGKNRTEEWTLEGHDTFFIGSGETSESESLVGAATLIDPLSAMEGTPVRPESKYRVSLLVAAHRCAAALKVVVLDKDGEVVFAETRDAGYQYKGGTEADRYDNATIEFTAPADAATVRIMLEKGRTEQKTSSYVFFACPELREYTVARSGSAKVLSSSLLAFARSDVGPAASEVVLAAPDEIFDGRSGRAEVVVSSGGQTERWATTFERLLTVEVSGMRIENSFVLFNGRIPVLPETDLTLGIFVDGELNVTFEPEIFDRHFSAVVMLKPQHLDGRLHVIEVRALPSQAPLGYTFDILPMQITPWQALQTYATAPLNITATPAAPHHFRSYKGWAEQAATNGGKIPTNLAALQAELLQGFKKRKSYPKLTFPKVANPDVSIVIPLHNKFEVTYLCLCSLLFAYSKASFEVIMVNDGSTDETAEIADFVEGVSVVVHPAALGFVHSCNDGAKLAKGKYVCFLNNDTEVTADWLDELLDVFANFDNVGLVGSKLLYPNGKLQEAGGIVWRSGNPWNVGRNGNPHDPRFNYLRQVDYLSGAAICLPRDLWKQVDGFSKELAPAYFEDTDLALKVREAGKLVVYVPTSNVFHFEGQSAGTSTASGMKRYQEVNRPKFRRKWAHLFGSHGVQGELPDREKDRNIGFRVLYLDERFPYVDGDAGSYSAFQEIRMLQAMGAKVTFLPKNLAWMDRHTLALQRIGVECLYAPFVMQFEDYVREHAAEYDVVYVCRYRLAQQMIGLVREAAPAAKVVLNLADLHFLREMREAAAGSPGYSYDGARATRDAELAVVMSADLTLSYSDIEIAVIESNLGGTAKVAKLPWVVDLPATKRPAFSKTRGLLFLGGFGHPPNIEAVKFFVRDVMPTLCDTLPEITLTVVGSKAPEEIEKLASDSVDIKGYLPSLDEAFDNARVFVAPLLAGAGIKGKVLEAMARGIPSVLSPVAIEGTGLVDGVDCLVASNTQEWVEAVVKLYTDEALNTSIGAAARRAAANRFSFERGAEQMQDSLAHIDLLGTGRPALVYKHARPHSYG